MNAIVSVNKQSPVQAPAQTANSPTVEAQAKEILEVGKRSWQTDDYEARVEAFGEAMDKLDTQGREDLLAEVIKQDGNALNSWLTPERINALTDSGRLAATERNAIVESVASAFNNDRLPSHELYDSMTGQVIGTHNALDAWMAPSGLSDVDGYVENARHMRDFAELFSGPQYSAAVSEFRNAYSQHLIKNYASNDKLSNYEQRDYATMQAAVLLNGDSARGDITAQTLNELPEDQLHTFMSRLADVSPMYGNEFLKNITGSSAVAMRDNLTAKDIALHDQYAGLMSQVAGVGTSDAEAAAVKLARLPALDEDAFKDNPDRANALAQLFNAHTTPILDQLSDFDDKQAANSDDPDKFAYMQNASELGSLFKATMFNPDSSSSTSVQASVLRYADAQKVLVNSPEGDADARGRLAMLSAASADAITQGFHAIEDDKKAQQDLIGFIADVALAGVPMDKLKDGVAGMLGDVFDRPAVKDALKGISGELVDSATGKLTDSAKEKLADALGKDETNMLTQQAASNAFRSAILNGIENQDRYGDVKSDTLTILNGIEAWRDR